MTMYKFAGVSSTLNSHSIQSIPLARKHQNTHSPPSLQFIFPIRSIYPLLKTQGNKIFLRTLYSYPVKSSYHITSIISQRPPKRGSPIRRIPPWLNISQTRYCRCLGIRGRRVPSSHLRELVISQTLGEELEV